MYEIYCEIMKLIGRENTVGENKWDCQKELKTR